VSAGWPAGDPRDVARAIVHEPRFRGDTAPAAAGPTLLERLLTWIGDRLSDVLRGIDHVLGPANALSRVLEVVLVLAAIAGGIALLVRFARLRGREPRPVAPTATALATALTSAQLLELARRYVRDERWHDAASALVRAALRALDESGRLRFDAARTAGEARQLLGDPRFDAFELEATAALFAAGAATAERVARLRAAYAQTFGVPA
jgi:hypothetical protein